jgi:peptidyl-prolyl cis-trans isomerase C
MGDKARHRRADAEQNLKDSLMSFSFSAGSPALRRKATLLGAALALLVGASTPGVAQDKDPVVATVNGTQIHQSDITAAEEEAGQLPPMSAEQKQDYMVQFLTDMTLLTQAAEAKKIGQSNDFKRKMEFMRKKLLMESLLQSAGKEATTDEVLHKTYDEAVKSMPAEEEVHARHILIRAPQGDEKASDDAKKKIEAVIARLKKGEDFAKVAAEVTEDPSGKANGGDLGWFTKEQMVPEFSDAAFGLKAGDISGPVHTQFGWHVLKAEGKRTKAAPTFNEVKPQLEQYVVRKAQAELVTKLRAEAKIEKPEKKAEAKPATPAPAAPPAPAK